MSNISYEYDAFGNLLEESGIYNPFRYNGQYTDEETGLIYLRNRYYDPGTGRFTQEDPAKDGFNWYAYCGNNPILFTDPWGLDPDNYVMIKYSVENTGMFSLNGFDSERLISYIRNDITGETIGFQVDRVVQIQDDNGDIVYRAISNVDALYEFLYSFGYRGTPESLLHNPRDEFNSLNETAYAWALRYNKQSVTYYNDEGGIGYERGSYIYKNSEKGTYFFGYPVEGEKSEKEVNFQLDGKAVGVIHSHGADSNGKYIDYEFSSSDLNNAPFRGKHKYLVTPNGQLLYREPNATATFTGGQGGYIVVGVGAGIYPDYTY